jgi:hypothetical protein
MIRIYVNRKAIDANNQGGHKPVVTVQSPDGSTTDCYGVAINAPSRVVYSPLVTVDGAHVWIETEGPVEMLGKDSAKS